jgi:hypothetical protein
VVGGVGAGSPIEGTEGTMGAVLWFGRLRGWWGFGDEALREAVGWVLGKE